MCSPDFVVTYINIKGNIAVAVPDSLDLITPYVLREQEDWFEDEIEFVRQMLRPGMQAIDIGANYGLYTLAMAKCVQPDGRIWAFEPASCTANYLKQSINYNQITNVRLIQAGLSNREGQAKLYLHSNSELNSLTSVGCHAHESIRLLRLDDCAQEYGWKDIDFVKLDAEGEEGNIIKGGTNFLSSQSPLIMFELKAGDEINLPLIQQFSEFCYATYRLIPGLNLLAPFDPSETVDPYQLNLFCCKPDRGSLLEEQGLLATGRPDTLALPDTDATLWQSYISGLTYSRKLLKHWVFCSHDRCSPGWDVYQKALNYYVQAHSKTVSSTTRYAYLQQSMMELSTLLDTQTNLSRLQTFARISWEMGKRQTTVQVLNLLVRMFASNEQLHLTEPFLAVSDRFDFVDPGDHIGPWCLSAILEQREKLRAFSSYYTGRASGEDLETLDRLGFQGAEMERRRQLIRIRHGMQKVSQFSPLLAQKAPDNLNPQFWVSVLPEIRSGQPKKDQEPLTIATAFQLYQAANLHGAAQCCEGILKKDPDNADVLHLLGLIYCQSKNYALAEEFIRRSLAVNPQDADAQRNLGVVLEEQGKFEEAAKAYRQAIFIRPDYAEAHFNLGNALREQGTLDEAVTAYRKAISLQPNHAEALNNLGIALQNQDELNESVTAYRDAISIRPDYAEAYSNLGNALREQGRLDEAAEACRKAISIRPDYAEAFCNFGIVLQEQGLLDKAIKEYKKAISIRADCAEAYSNLGDALRKRGRLDEAVEACRKGVDIRPNFPESFNNLGNALKDQGKPDEAVASYKQAISIRPDYAEAHFNLGNVLREQGKLDEAVSLYRKAIFVRSDYAEAFCNLGLSLQEQGLFDEAIAAYHKAISIKPNFAEAYCNMGIVLQGQGKVSEALRSYRKAISIKPNYAEAYCNIGNALQVQEKPDEALVAYQEAIRIRPDFAEAYCNLVECLVKGHQLAEADRLAHAVLERYADKKIVLPAIINALRKSADWEGLKKIDFIPDFNDRNIDAKYVAAMLLFFHYDYRVDKHTLFHWHRVWGEKIEARCRRHPLPNNLKKRCSEKIRIGYLSPDFREHSVGYFIHNIIKNHDKSRFQIFCYSNHRSSPNDRITHNIQQACFQFLQVEHLTDRHLAQRIRDDEIDILIDLAGHTTNSRVAALGFRSAPIQITYLGYPDTTGLKTVDYRITDHFAEADSGNMYTEELIKLPECFLSFGEFAARNTAESPAVLRKGYVTFGSFNNICKVTPETIRVWSGILKMVPSAKLVIKDAGCDDDFVRRNILSEFQKHTIHPDRIELIGHVRAKETHLDYYNEIDIALDTFPYNGTTTTCEALWMGVPVITWVGEPHCRRVSYSILKNIGLDGLIGTTEDEYIRIAVDVAESQGSLQEIRHAIPKLLKDSILCHPERLTRQLEHELIKLVNMKFDRSVSSECASTRDK